MRTVSINIEDSLFTQVLNKFQEVLKRENIQSDFTFVDEVGDQIVIKNDVQFVVPTKEDLELINNSKKEDFISSEEARKLLLNV